MSPAPATNSRLRVLFISAALLLVCGGLMAGYYLPDRVWKAVGLQPAAPEECTACGECGPTVATANRELPPCCQARGTAAASDANLQEFSLTDADAKDTLEAPVLIADAQGRVFLAWASETGDNERTLMLATSLNGGKKFDPPLPVQKSEIFTTKFESNGRTMSRSIRMVPLLAVQGDKLLLGWLQAMSENKGIKFMLAESDNGGLTFASPICIHQDQELRPAFSALAANDNTIAASWLGTTDKVKLAYFTVKSGDESFAAEQAIPAGDNGKSICPCCPTTVAIAPNGEVYVAFRNLVQGKRDIFVARWTAANGLEPAVSVVEQPTWEFDGCPHDGASLAVSDDTVHVAWMDGRSGTQRVYYARSAAGDLKFVSQPLHAAGPGSQGNAKLCLDRAGGLHAVWEESLPETADDAKPAAEEKEAAAADEHAHHHAADASSGRMIMYAYAPAGGEFGTPKGVLPRTGAFQTRPTLAATDDGIVVAFHELDATGKRVVVTRVEIPQAEAEVAAK